MVFFGNSHQGWLAAGTGTGGIVARSCGTGGVAGDSRQGAEQGQLEAGMAFPDGSFI